MSRLLFGPLGLAIALAPEPILEAFESVALEEPEEASAKPWIVPAMRAEGVGYALVSLVGGRPYSGLMTLVGAVGAIVAAFPRQYLAFGTELAYEDPETVEWRDGFVTAVRIIGAVLVVLAIRTRLSRDEAEAADESGEQ
ncbi:hypothetical protein [Natrarchaeobaculum aegyptiacum]|uniref:Uncharacterized protein n=1 Tax=Natrarchaeobaculum aegyptiacum TaxID=745377 RepID=A0A2Z2HTV9_9EURY|nr:hypothetical protein [Natrarchaeobaculum aegyptiacum]ARS90671.1 hypothetical protein B1756_13660 [Natrarchaeobaculum aegyptiacum]